MEVNWLVLQVIGSLNIGNFLERNNSAFSLMKVGVVSLGRPFVGFSSFVGNAEKSRVQRTAPCASRHVEERGVLAKGI
jgi:hypothetical protein